MAVVSSRTVKGELMPSVREQAPADVAEPLEYVEIRPGVVLKLNAADKRRLLGDADQAPAEEPPATPRRKGGT